MQKIICLTMRMTAMALMLTMMLIGCASTEGSRKVDMDKVLISAGFKKAVADTPEKLGQLKKLPQRRVVPHQEGDKIFYIYADIEKCKCAYAGDEEAYRKYQKLTHKNDISEKERQKGARDQQRQMDWGDWSFDQSW